MPQMTAIRSRSASIRETRMVRDADVLEVTATGTTEACRHGGLRGGLELRARGGRRDYLNGLKKNSSSEIRST
jgi:hypothetical protein